MMRALRIAQHRQQLLDDQRLETCPPHVRRSSCGCCGRRARTRCPHQQHDGDGLTEHRPDVAGQEHRLKARDQVAGRHDHRDPLDRRRHGVDLEEEAGEQEGRQEGGHQGKLRGQELVLRGSRDQQPLPERRDQEGRAQRIERDDRAAKRHAEDEDGERARKASSRQGRAGNTGRSCRQGARSR